MFFFLFFSSQDQTVSKKLFKKYLFKRKIYLNDGNSTRGATETGKVTGLSEEKHIIAYTFS